MTLRSPRRTSSVNGIHVLIMEDIEGTLNGDEKILWQGRPAWLPFFTGAIMSFLFGSASS